MNNLRLRPMQNVKENTGVDANDQISSSDGIPNVTFRRSLVKPEADKPEPSYPTTSGLNTNTFRTFLLMRLSGVAAVSLGV